MQFKATGPGNYVILQRKCKIGRVYDYARYIKYHNEKHRATTSAAWLCLEICFSRQEAPLSHRDHTTLRVTEYFAKSLNVIQNDTALLSTACVSPY